MNKSIFSLLITGGLIFSLFAGGQTAQAQGFSFPAQMNKSFMPLSIKPGGISRLEITVYNPNVFELTNAAWTDNLASVQPGISIANPPNISSTCGSKVFAPSGGTVLSLSGGMEGTKSSLTISLQIIKILSYLIGGNADSYHVTGILLCVQASL